CWTQIGLSIIKEMIWSEVLNGLIQQWVTMLKDILRKLLNDRDITVAGLSRKTGVPKTNITTWLNGGNPQIDQLDKVAQYLEVPLEYLAFGRVQEDPFAQLLNKVEIHSGLYEITVKKVTPKKLIKG